MMGDCYIQTHSEYIYIGIVIIMINDPQKILGYCLLQLISTLIFFIGYFSSPQEVHGASYKENPLFEKDDWFFPEFSRVVIMADTNHYLNGALLDEAVEQDPSRKQKFEMEFGMHMDNEQLLNSLMRGVCPISLLQYGLSDFTQWDSVLYQLQKRKQKYYVSSALNYDSDYNANLEYVKFPTSSIVDFKEAVMGFVEAEEFALLYIDNLVHDQGLSDWVVRLAQEAERFNQERNHSTIFLVVQQPPEVDILHAQTGKGSLWVLAQDVIFAQHVREQGEVYSVDSLASSIASLLDIPIPNQNHGSMLPGLVYVPDADLRKFADLDRDPLKVQAWEFLVNLKQLLFLAFQIDNHNILYKSQQQKLYNLETQFLTNQTDTDDLTQLIRETRRSSKMLNTWLNERISGNLLVLGIGSFLSLISFLIYFVKSKSQINVSQDVFHIKTIDKIVLSVIIAATLFYRQYTQLLASILTILAFTYILQKAPLYALLKFIVVVALTFAYLECPVPFGEVLVLPLLFSTIKFLQAVWLTQKRSFEMIIMISTMLLSYLPIPYAQGFFQLFNLVGSIKLFCDLKLAVRISLVLIFNYSLVQSYVPLTLLSCISVLLYMEYQMERFDLSILVEQNDSLVVNPITSLLYFVVVSTCQYTLPMNPAVVQAGPYLLQIFAGLHFISFRRNLRGVMKVGEREKVETRISEWILEDSAEEINLADYILVLGLVVIVEELAVFWNEFVKFDTRVETLGNEYFCLQDSVSHLALLVLYLIIAKKQYILQKYQEVQNH